jgi:hypothetical protein
MTRISQESTGLLALQIPKPRKSLSADPFGFAIGVHETLTECRIFLTLQLLEALQLRRAQNRRFLDSHTGISQDLRYYDEVGILKPFRVDSATGYRYYSATQVPRLHRILALKDVGFPLESVAAVLFAALPSSNSVEC